MRRYSLTTFNKWINAFNEMKALLDENNDIYELSSFCHEKKISTCIITFLRDNNIIYKDILGAYKWNDKIPVSFKIYEKYRFYMKEQREKTKQYKKVTTMSKTPLPPKPTYQEKIKDKVKKQREIVIQQPQKQIGLIRKFLKWLW